MIDLGEGFTLHPLADGHLPVLESWLEDAALAGFFGGARTIPDLRAHLGTLESRIEPYIVLRDGEPLCFLFLFPSHVPFWQRVAGYGPEERLSGLDVFVGDPAARGHGTGSALVRAAAAYLVAERGATKVIADPSAANEAALRCFEKAGFQRARHLPGHEDDGSDCWLMEYAPV